MLLVEGNITELYTGLDLYQFRVINLFALFFLHFGLIGESNYIDLYCLIQG